MTRAGLPVRPGSPSRPRRASRSTRRPHASPTGCESRSTRRCASSSGAPARASASAENPLLVSVRSGARVSMPGMMDTILNLGLNDETVAALAKLTGNERFAWDAYRRFITMFSNVVLGVEKDHFEELIDDDASARSASRPIPRSTPRRGRAWSRDSKRSCASAPAREFPQDVHEQLELRDRRGLRLVELQARDRLSPLQQDSRRLGHGRHRHGDGLRQHGRRFGNRRRVHAQSEHRRARSFSASICATRRARTSSPAFARPRRSPISRDMQPDVYAQFDEIADAARAALPRHAGPRVYGRARQAVHAADAQRRSAAPKRR